MLNSNAADKITEITKELCDIDVAGMQHFIGVRFVDKFKTHPVTSKHNYLSLQNDRGGYFSVNKDGVIFKQNVGDEKISSNDIFIIKV